MVILSLSTAMPLGPASVRRRTDLGHVRPMAHATCIATKDLTMSMIAWILLGLVSGFVGSKLVNHRGEGVLMDVVLGVVGAFIGGYLFQLFGLRGVTGLNLWSMMVAVVGAVALLVIYHTVRRTTSD
jgi:uncharacterized membrane protein YeaQ/YmgE (transglycosylase-associated protein family)